MGGDVSINVNASLIVANDFDSHVIEIYKEFQKNSIKHILNHIENRIEEYDLSITNSDGFNKFRNYYNSCEYKNPLDLFVLICYSFNHQFRFNGNGGFNMPFGKERSCFNKSIKQNLRKELVILLLPTTVLRN